MFKRSIHAEVRKPADGNDAGLVEMSISSDAPIERYFGVEVLRHTPDAVDLARLKDGRHPLLLNHDTERQIGVIKSAELDAKAGKVRASTKFSRSQLGQEIQQDVEDEVRTLVSVGYMIDQVEEVRAAGDKPLLVRGDDGVFTLDLEAPCTVVRSFKSADEFARAMETEFGADFYRAGPAACRAKGGDEPPVFIVTRWQPFEASIVPVPADVSVGVGRAAGAAAPAPQPAAATTAPALADASPSPIVLVESRNMTETNKDLLAEVARRDAIIDLAKAYEKYVKPGQDVEAVRSGMTVEAFKDLIMDNMRSHHTAVNESALGLTQNDAKRYSFGRALVAHLTGDWSKAGFERECSKAVEQIMGRSAEGFFVPPDIFRRDFNVGTSTEAGNLVYTQLRTDMYVDALRAAMVFGKLNATYLPGLTANVDLPRKATPGTLGMVTEIGSASETNPLTAKATLSPKRISAYTEVSKQALIQSAMSIENMLRDDLVTGAAVLLENQIINGAGTGAEITGLRNTTGIGTVSENTNGLAPTWGAMVDLESACANANAEPDRFSGYLVNTKTRGKLKQVQMGTNLPFIWQNGDTPVNGYRAAVTNNVPSNLTKGTSTTVASAALFCSDFSMVTIGLFGAPDVVVDPYTKADTGQVKITLNQFADMKCRQPACCAKREDILTA